MIPHSITASSNYAFVSLFVLKMRPLASKLTYCAFKCKNFVIMDVINAVEQYLLIGLNMFNSAIKSDICCV